MWVATLAPLVGAALTILSSMALGTLLLRRLGLSTSGTLTRTEYRLFAFLSGAACLSLLVLVTATLQLVYSSVFCAIAAVLFCCAWIRERETHFDDAPTGKNTWAALALVAALPFLVLYFFNAWAPEASPDGSAYHLGNVLRFVQNHGLMPIRDIYGAFPEGLEMLFLFAFPIGRHSAAALIHFSFLIVLPLLMYAWALRAGFPRAGVVAAFLVFVSPVFGIDGVSAYNDVALATDAFAVVYLLDLWLTKKDDRFVVLAGILAGFAFGIKYTGAIVAIYALLVLVVRPAREWRLRPILLFSLCCFALAVPWLLKNALYMHNPVSPFLNRVFPNAWVSPRFEADWARDLASMLGTNDLMKLAIAYMVRGENPATGANAAGVLGPLFLLVPLGIVSLRHRQGRRLLLAALLFGLPVLANQGTRFLMAAAPPAALALAMAITETSYVTPVMIALAAFSCWPDVVTLYSDQYAWRLTSDIPFAAAWHRRRADAYLHNQLGFGYDMARLINQKTPPGSRIFCFSCPPQAYVDREIMVAYESTLGNAFIDMLNMPNQAGRQPAKLINLTFAPADVSKLRISAPALRPNELWNVHELRVRSGGVEMPRSPAWHIDAWPDPWEARFAFDNNPATRWATEQAGAAGAYLEIDFGRSIRMDSVQIECDPGQTEQLAVLAAGTSGDLAPLNVSTGVAAMTAPGGLRRDAVFELKKNGFQYLVISGDDYNANDYTLRAGAWGIQRVAQTGNLTLFRLD